MFPGRQEGWRKYLITWSFFFLFYGASHPETPKILGIV